MASGSSLSDISLVVITYNEEDNISNCLGSAEGVGEIIVVDSFSTDATVDIAEKYGAKVYRRKFVSNSDQKNWAVEKAGGEWILILDADESLSAELRDEISGELEFPEFDGYRLRRRNRFMGRWIRHCGWNRDWVLRLFKSGRGSYIERAVHEKFKLVGSEGSLQSPLYHNPYRDMADYLDRMGNYAMRGALELRKKGRSWFPAILTRPAARFVRMYLLQLGFLDGREGFILCATAAASVFFKYLFLMELSGTDGGQEDQLIRKRLINF